MTIYILIALCVIILISYVFDITAKYSKIPGVILLIITGMFLQYLLPYAGVRLPNFSEVLPFLGTLGLILIVLEGSLDLTLKADRKILIAHSISSAIVLFVLFVALFSYVLYKFYNYPLVNSIINTIPLGIISSAVAIPSASGLTKSDREFVTYESAISDIFGILVFDFVLFNEMPIGRGILGFTSDIVLTIIIAIVFSFSLAFLLHKTTHHVKYVVIMTSIVLIYAMAKMIHLPSLLVVLVFGLIMNNNHLFNFKFTSRFVNFNSFNTDLHSFKNITGELTFIVRSLFFVIFGFYTSLSDLLSLNNLQISLAVVAGIFIIRFLFFKNVLKKPFKPLLFFAPRGLITILLFLSIPENQLLPFMNKGVISQVIFITILLMTFGNVLFKNGEIALPDENN